MKILYHKGKTIKDKRGVDRSEHSIYRSPALVFEVAPGLRRARNDIENQASSIENQEIALAGIGYGGYIVCDSGLHQVAK